MGKEKIGFFLSSFGIGGAERQYWYLMNHIDRSQYEVFVIQISHKRNRPKDFLHEGMRVETFEMRHKLDFTVVFRIAWYVRQNNIDLIQSLLFLDNQIAKLVGLFAWKPVITSVRGGPHLGKFRTWIDHHFDWLSTRIVVNSKWLKNILVKDGVKESRVMVIYNGINPAAFQCDAEPLSIKKKFGIDEGKQTLAIVARLHPMKQHWMFFDVIKVVSEKVPGVLALVVGEGELRQELEQYVDRLGIRGNVIFLGAVKAELPELLRISNVLLLTSGWGESLPNALLEALSAGVPVVSTNIHGIPEIIDDGVNGFLVEDRDVSLMAERVLTLLNDDSLRDGFVKNGLNKVAEFSMRNMVKGYERLYGEVLRLR